MHDDGWLLCRAAVKTGISGSIWRTRSTGTYHRSMNCPHINGEIVEPVAVDDVAEPSVVAAYGPNACTTCFPSAPTRRTALVPLDKQRKTMTPEWDAEDERLHPRSNDGKFTDGNGGPGTPTPEATDSMTPEPPREQPQQQTTPTQVPVEQQPRGEQVDLSSFVPDPSTTGTGSKDDPVRTSNIEDAAAALALGLYVELDRPEEVATLLDKLKEQIDAAKASGQDATIDLCNVTVRGTNLFCTESKGIPRAQMPQLKAFGVPEGTKAHAEGIRTDDGEIDIQPMFFQRLVDEGVTAEETTMLASHLKASQNQLNAGKVAGITDFVLNGGGAEKIGASPIFVSSDGYIVDGHHRWASLVSADYADGDATDLSMSVWKIDMPIIELLKRANDFADEYGIPQQSVKAGSKSGGCIGCGDGPSFEEINARARAKHSMADRSGIPEVDRLIEDFLDEPLDERNWGEGAGTVRDLMDGARSFGMCQVITEQFVEFAKARGFDAYATDTDRREMKYRTRGKPPGGNTFFYFEHTVASVYPPGEWPNARWSNGDIGEVYIDFSASQYGYKDHPKVTSTKRTGFGAGGRWYHASPARLPRGTVLVPGGGPSTDQSFYDAQAAQDTALGYGTRGEHVWITPDRQDASFWASMLDAPYIYEVDPIDPRPWGVTGADGYVCSSAEILSQVSTTGSMHTARAGYLSPRAFKKLQQEVRAKVARVPMPTQADIERNLYAMRTDGRAGGDFRGNSYDRRRRTQRLLEEFGDGVTAGCAYCGKLLDATTLEEDKIIGGAKGGRYILANLIPACRECNLSRSDAPFEMAASKHAVTETYGIRFGADGEYRDIGSREEAYQAAQEESADEWVPVYVIGHYGNRVATFEGGHMVWERRTASRTPCSACSGSGEQGTGHECYACDGTGYDRTPGIDNANPENGLLVGRDDAAGVRPIQARAIAVPDLSKV